MSHRNGKPYTTPEKKAEVFRLRNQGYLIREIAELTGINQSTCGNILNPKPKKPRQVKKPFKPHGGFQFFSMKRESA